MRADNQISSERVENLASGRSGRFPDVVMLVPMVGLALSELLLFAGYRPYAAVGHMITVLFAAAATTWLGGDVEAFGGLALIAVTRLVTLGLPAFGEFTLFWLGGVYVPVAVGLYVLLSMDDELDLGTGVLTGFQLLPVAIAIGVVLAEMPFAIIGPGSLVTNWDSTLAVFLFVAVMFVLAFVEETVFRGLLQRALSIRFGLVTGILLASALFALTRSGYGLSPVIFLAFANGVALGILYDLSDSLAFVVVVHTVLNVCLFGIFPDSGPFLL